MENLNQKYNTEFTNKLLMNQHIFFEIYEACNKTFEYGCGSYLISGFNYEYCDKMYEKQELLFALAKNATQVLEIGTYMGHSLLIMLLANPMLRITCIDIECKYTEPAVKVLNKYFSNRVEFIHNVYGSIKVINALQHNSYDLFHIDGNHDNNYIREEFKMIRKLNNGHMFNVLFDDQECMKELQKEILNDEYGPVISMVKPYCKWNNIYFKILLYYS